MKSASQEGNLLACRLRPRPMSFRNVSTSGTNGRGLGIVGGGRVLCRHRIWLLNVFVVGAETSGRSDDQRLWALIFEVSVEVGG